jgi:hypothetical protein
MAKKHDEQQRAKNNGGEQVARKFMNYIEYGTPRVDELTQTFPR